MKRCPYCAEEIQDDAIKCRWCQSWLVEEVPAGADAPPKAAPTPSSADSAPSSPTSSPVSATAEAAPSPATAPAQAAPATFQSAPAQAAPQAAPAQAAPQAAPAQVAAQSTPAAAAPADTKTEFTHTGSRYLLGYGGDFFGIWDRNAPQQPIERFPRNDQGWATAWARYASIETNWMDLRTGQKSG